ncbi:MAG TPA: ABC transporter ATP-binding protein [Ignavibacteriaceae bacterium]|nr:ABC transporter ATP-binding protein [Ignavibacteriaceae bacterium]
MGIIETKELTKVYSSGAKRVLALSDFNLSLESGTIFGLLGPNGAGKTTLIKILLGIIFPTSGQAFVLNHNLSDYEMKKKIGYLPENHRYPNYLTGGEVLKFFGRLSGLDGINLDKKIDELLELMKLSKWKKTKVKNYSKGMMQRLGLAQSLINDPELIYLDEPTDGVDPIGRKEIRDILLNLKTQSKTIFLNSHLLSEVELITDRVAILNKGKLIREGTVQELTEKKEEYRLTFEKINTGFQIPADYNGVSIKLINSYSCIVKAYDLSQLNGFIDFLRNNQILIAGIVKEKSSLEDMFISLINEAEKESAK